MLQEHVDNKVQENNAFFQIRSEQPKPFFFNFWMTGGSNCQYPFHAMNVIYCLQTELFCSHWFRCV